MDMRGVESGRDASGSTGTPHARARARVTRLSLPGRTVIRKEFLGTDAERRMRRELAMLERLRGLPGVVQLADEPWFPGSITLADAGGSRVADLPTPLDVDLLVRLGSALARAVAEMHRRGVLHRDVCPANVVVSPDGEPCLVGFGLATSLAEIRPEFTHHTEIVGTLAYLAPEQTGRTGRSVDQRADLYALGATLYELATGGPPFGSGDPLQLTHDHLAQIPTPPAEVNPAVPAALSQIIVHLLEKEPDRRYQSAEGVVHDLEELAADPGRTLPIGEHDVPLRLLPASRLVGREAETAELHAAFTGALSGSCPGVLVAGAPGVGKTALVNELRPVVADARGWFVAGTFDQYRRDLDFDAVNQALRALGRLLLAEPEADLAEIRDKVLAAVGANAALLTASVPEFATVLRVPPDAGDPLTARARAQRAAAQVLRAAASRERPLVVFVDDLQWAGGTPLGLVDLLLTEEPVDQVGRLAGRRLQQAQLDPAAQAGHRLQQLPRRRRHRVDPGDRRGGDRTRRRPVERRADLGRIPPPATGGRSQHAVAAQRAEQFDGLVRVARGVRLDRLDQGRRRGPVGVHHLGHHADESRCGQVVQPHVTHAGVGLPA